MSEEKKSSKEKIVETASRLFQVQGYHATGLNQITKESGAPKGSLYYYFPDGKEQLASVAVECTAVLVANRIKEGLKEYDNPVEAIQNFINNLADSFEREEQKQGLPVAAVALETSHNSDVIRNACQTAYNMWHQAFANKLMESGMDEEKALEIGLVINAMIEGAFIIVVTKRDSEPLRKIARYIPSLLK